MNVDTVTEWLRSTATGVEPRDYQAEAWLRLWQRRAAQRKRALVHLATGLGKTLVAAVDVLHYLRVERPRGRALFVSHMTDISRQARDTFMLVDPALTTAMFRGRLEDVDVTFSTFQALHRKLGSIDPDYFSYIVWDEAHHIEAETFSAVRNHFKPEFELGLTATPERADGRDILNYFGRPLFSKGLADGIAEGWLSAVDYHIVFDEAIKKAMSNKFEPKTLKEIRDLFAIRTRNEVISREVLRRRHDIGMDQAKTIAFCQNIEAAGGMATLLGGEVYHSGISTDERTDIMQRFKDGRLQVICTVDMFNEGIDIPDARLVVFLRSTSSRTIFEQQLGRGLRRAPGKDKVTVLDFVANIERINFVRDLGHTISVLRGSGERYSGLNTGDGAERTPYRGEYFGLSNFDFEDQAIELLERYETIKGIEYLTAEQVVAAFHELQNVALVAQRFAVSTTAVYKQLRKAGVDTSGHLRNDLDSDDVVRRYFELKSAKKVGRLFGISSSTVLDRVRKAGYEVIPRMQQKITDECLLQAYERNSYNLRATSRELGQDRNVFYRRIKAMGIDTSKQRKQSLGREELDEIYQRCNGNIDAMAEEAGSWADVYRALDKHGYLIPRARPVTSALAAAAYYKFGSSTKAAACLGVSPTYVSRLSKKAKYIPKYNRKRQMANTVTIKEIA